MAGLANIYLTMNYFENPKVYMDCSFIIFFIMSFVKAKDDEYCYMESIKNKYIYCKKVLPTFPNTRGSVWRPLPLHAPQSNF